MIETLPALTNGAPRSATTRAYGQATVLVDQRGMLVPARNATVRPLVAGTTTPYTGLLYGDATTATPLAFPVAVGSDGVVEVWSDTPVRLDLEATLQSVGVQRVTLDVEFPPVDEEGRFVNIAGDAMTGPLQIAGKSVGRSPNLNNQLVWNDNGFYVPEPAPVDLSGYLTQAAADTRYLQLTGGTLSGMLTVNPYVVAPQYVVSGAPGTSRILSFGQFGVANRWYLSATADAETGASAGSNFEITRFSDAGVPTSTLVLNRATGAATFGGNIQAQSNLEVWGGITLSGGTPRISSTTQPLRLNTGAGDLIFERGGGQVGSFRASDNFFTTAVGATFGGAIGPATNNAYDSGSTSLRWRKLWAVDLDLSGAANHANRMTVAGVAQPRISVQSSAPSSPATGDLWIW